MYVGVEGQVGHVLLAIELLGVAHGIAGPGSALKIIKWRKLNFQVANRKCYQAEPRGCRCAGEHFVCVKLEY